MSFHNSVIEQEEEDELDQVNDSTDFTPDPNADNQKIEEQLNSSQEEEEDEEALLDELKQLSRQLSRDITQIAPEVKILKKNNKITEKKIQKVQEKMGKMAQKTKTTKKKTLAEFKEMYDKFKDFEHKKNEKVQKFREEIEKTKASEVIGKPQLIAKKQPSNRQPLISRIDQIIKTKEAKLEERRKELKDKREQEAMVGVTFAPKINENSEILMKSHKSKDLGSNEIPPGLFSKNHFHHNCTHNHHECPEGGELFKPKINKLSEILADNVKKKTSHNLEERLLLHGEIIQTNHAQLVKSVTPTFTPIINAKSIKYTKNSKAKKLNGLSTNEDIPKELLDLYANLDISNLKTYNDEVTIYDNEEEEGMNKSLTERPSTNKTQGLDLSNGSSSKKKQNSEKKQLDNSFGNGDNNSDHNDNQHKDVQQGSDTKKPQVTEALDHPENHDNTLISIKEDPSPIHAKPNPTSDQSFNSMQQNLSLMKQSFKNLNSSTQSTSQLLKNSNATPAKNTTKSTPLKAIIDPKSQSPKKPSGGPPKAMTTSYISEASHKDKLFETLNATTNEIKFPQSSTAINQDTSDNLTGPKSPETKIKAKDLMKGSDSSTMLIRLLKEYGKYTNNDVITEN